MKIIKRISCILLTIMLVPSVYTAVNAAEVGDVNLAKGAQAEVRYFDSDGNFLNADLTNIGALTDDNSFSLYQTPVGVENGYIILDMYYIHNFNRVYLRETNSTISGFTVYTSNNKKNWTKQFSGGSVGTYGANACFERPARARYVKLEIETANQYRDAAVTLSDIMVSFTRGPVKDDLKNAVHLAGIKEKLISSEMMKTKFTDREREALSREKEKASEILAKASVTQQEIDRECRTLRAVMRELEDKTVSVESDFDIVEQRYADFFVKNNQELTESRMTAIHANEATVEKARKTMIRQPKAEQLWPEYIAPLANTTMEPGKIANSLGKVKQMAIAYKQNGNKYQGDEDVYNDIVYALDYLLTKKYSPSIEMYGNWYYWQISVPATMTDIMVILKKDLEPEMLKAMEEAVIYRIGDDFHYTWYGANRMYLAAISLKLGVAMNNEEYIHRAIYSVSEENASKNMQSVNSSGDDNGYFWDGSYMFHSGILYNTTYGRDQLANTLNIIGYLYETPWQIDQGMVDDMASRVHDVYEYVIYNGYSVDVAGGRGLGEGAAYGRNMTSSIELLASYLEGDQKTELLSIAKQFKIEQGIDDALTRDDSIPARGRITKLKRYPIGDKLVLHTPDFGFTLGMFSDRTKCFEAPNGDAMQAWYVSSGFTEILNNDRLQYDRDYWIAVDHYRLPGTTVDRVARSLTRYEGEIYNAEDWCGMIDCDEKYGAAGMMICNWNSSLSGKKSYFMFDNEIVCLGAGISNGTAEIETTVENRKLKEDASNKVLVNGAEFNGASDTLMSGVSTVWIEGNTEMSDIGYYFPQTPELHMLKEKREAAEADMWLSNTTNVVTENFFTMWFNHGSRPKNASYQYVILPNLTEVQTEEYSRNPDIEILDVTDEVHSVREKNLGVTGYNFWKKQGGKGSGASADGPLSLITKDADGEFSASMTDPVFKSERPVTVTFDTSVSKITECDERITVISMNPLTIKADLKDINGRKAEIKAKK
ncbi:MAG: polysaccharide lyase family 8 super-sandwich domain-containing protein [Clostridiales bacterium]|nr:polysaccharide lyase family 8 super-sandwich domain-containing protein [Clostridiales bacterium]